MGLFVFSWVNQCMARQKGRSPPFLFYALSRRKWRTTPSGFFVTFRRFSARPVARVRLHPPSRKAKYSRSRRKAQGSRQAQKRPCAFCRLLLSSVPTLLCGKPAGFPCFQARLPPSALRTRVDPASVLPRFLHFWGSLPPKHPPHKGARGLAV